MHGSKVWSEEQSQIPIHTKTDLRFCSTSYVQRKGLVVIARSSQCAELLQTRGDDEMEYGIRSDFCIRGDRESEMTRSGSV